ncbi:hypothetical protein DSO57_1016222 [Entomophthora muscae]|uniref:Uncharacterized protein n=1 Tax=Entomophthora muscae TaxID=34485 RepID=A0ACC2RJU5_9FUNG|nr:hypothetical protein DSO57_1016222 [Entomophthora muscae]
MSAASSSIYSGGVVNLEELAEKYQKLLQEYSRTKAQHAVLKKAVFEEKNKKESCLKELNDREQRLRKLEQEIDVLSFHNRGLTKKVEVLQNESSKFSNLGWGGSKSKKAPDNFQTHLEAAIMDLENKIIENETLHRELEDARSERSASMEEILRRNQELEKEKNNLVEELQISKDFHATSLATTLNEKEILESEVQGAKLALEKLLDTHPVSSPKGQLLDEAYQELIQYHESLQSSDLLLNTDTRCSFQASELLSKIIKLIEKGGLTEADHGIEQLISSLKDTQEAIEKRGSHVSEQSRRPEIVHAGSKLRESFKKMDRALCRIKRANSAISNENFENRPEVGSNVVYGIRGVQELRNSCSELFIAVAECAGFGVSLIHLENPDSGEHMALITELRELAAITKQLMSLIKGKLAPGHSVYALVLSIGKLQSTLDALFDALKINLSKETSPDDWLLKALNTQLIGFSIHTRNTLDKLLNLTKRWLMLFSTVDTNTNHAATETASVVDLTSQQTKNIQGLRRESLDLAAAIMSSEKAESELHARLDSEIDRSKKLDILLKTLQEKLEASDSKANDLNAQLKTLQDSNANLKQMIVSKDALISQLELKIQNNKDDSAEKHAEPIPLSKSISLPNGKTNGLGFKELTPEPEEVDLLSPNIPKATTNPPDVSPDHNVNFLKYLSNEEHYVEKIFKHQYETKLKELGNQVEVADSQSKRFHDAWFEVSDLLAESQTEHLTLKQQVASLTEQLAKSKEESLSLEENYKQQITYLTERYAELAPGVSK